MKNGLIRPREHPGERPRRGGRGLAALAVAVLMALAACTTTRGGSIPYDVANFGPPDTRVSETLGDDYRIAPLDTLAIKVFQVPDLSGSYEVDLTGNIAMPLIGNVKAVNQTTSEFQENLKQKLEVSYLKNPDVTVGIAKATGSNITVDGSVNSPGVFPVAGTISLVQAIAMARGLDDTANQHRVAIFRQIDGKRMAAAFDLGSIRKGEEQDPPIYRGDIIIVDGSSAKKAYKDVLKSIPLLAIFGPL